MGVGPTRSAPSLFLCVSVSLSVSLSVSVSLCLSLWGWGRLDEPSGNLKSQARPEQEANPVAPARQLRLLQRLRLRLTRRLRRRQLAPGSCLNSWGERCSVLEEGAGDTDETKPSCDLGPVPASEQSESRESREGGGEGEGTRGGREGGREGERERERDS